MTLIWCPTPWPSHVTQSYITLALIINHPYAAKYPIKLSLLVQQSWQINSWPSLTITGPLTAICDLEVNWFIKHIKPDLNNITPWWRHQMENFLCYWPFVQGIHQSPVNSPHKGQRRGALMLSLICPWINSWVNNGEAGDLRRHHAHYDIIVMTSNIHLCVYIYMQIFQY